MLLRLLVPAALLIGLYGRFKGIGTWPLGVDEFYMSRSIDHVLANGLPSFPCGGYYTRGLLFQYLVAALRMCGSSPEFSGRFVAAVSSLAVLPPAYLLGKRIQGPLTGWLAVIVLLISIWEIEMARFGRMYAPFQAVFLWYLLFYVRYTIDKNAVALRWMIGLSVVGVLTWEGGTLLGAVNIFAYLQFHEYGRLKAPDWRRLAALGMLFVLLYLASRDLRDVGASAVADAAAQAGAPHPAQIMGTLMSSLRAHWLWAVAFLLPLGLAAGAIRTIWSYRHRWMAFAGMSLLLSSALVHQFAAVAGLLALLLLTDLIDWRELTSRGARPFALALLALLAFWTVYDLSSGGRFLQVLFGFPDIYERIGRPWGRAVPGLTVGIVSCVVFWFIKSIGVPNDAHRPMKSLLCLLFLLVLMVGAIPTNRIETRYTFFLYPLLVIIVISAILELARQFDGRGPLRNLLLAASPLLFFAATEDFQFRQIAGIDSAAVNFRVHMAPARADHYYPRNDMRGIAAWLASHVRPGDVVVSGIPNLDQYYGGFDYFYLDEEDNRYDAYVCANGGTDRWTNHRILYKADALKSVVDSGHRVYGSVYSDVEARLRRDAQSQGWTVKPVYTAMDGKTDIVSIEARNETSRKN